MPDKQLLQETSSELEPFRIRFVRYGSIRREARWTTVEIMAKTSKDALKCVKNQYRRAGNFSVVK